MTRWLQSPIRQPGQPWSGIDTRSGKTDNGSGQLTEESVNVTINRLDTLSKRLGFIRGQNERFGTVVCGLHTYVDNCGNEWLLVASDESIAIRQPFAIPIFENDDSYPIDAFDEEGPSAINWRNTELYLSLGAGLQRNVGNSTPPFDAASYLRWFKAASSSAYQVTIQYEFDTFAAVPQVASITIKGSEDLSGRRLQADIVFDGTSTTARLYKVDLTGARMELGQIDVAGLPAGFLELRYERGFAGSLAVFTATMVVTPSGGGPQEVSSTAITELEDAEMGRTSAIGCSESVTILQVSGGPV
jgi:hypothetical protein